MLISDRINRAVKYRYDKVGRVPDYIVLKTDHYFEFIDSRKGNGIKSRSRDFHSAYGVTVVVRMWTGWPADEC